MRNIIIIFFLGVFLTACVSNEPQHVSLVYEPVVVTSKTASLIRLGDSMARAGDYASAVGFYQNAYEEQRNLALPLIKQATIFLQMNDVETAGERLARATQAEPNNPDVAITYARFLMDHYIEDAPVFLLDASQRFHSERFYNWLGVAQDLNGYHEEAQWAYQQGLLINQNDVSLLNNYGLSLAVTQKKMESYHIFEQAIEKEPENILYRQNLAIAQILNGDIAQARVGLDNVLPQQEIEALITKYKDMVKSKSPLDILTIINHS